MRYTLGRLAAAAALLLAHGPAMAEPPEEPRVIDSMAEVGRPGGELHMLISRARDTGLYNVYGYARLVGFTPDLRLVPDILAGFEVQDGRVFTFHLRKGHKWSDGQPLTAEDFRFYWEDVALDEELTPTGPDIRLVVEGELPKVEILDELTVRYAWRKPNAFFLPALAAATQLFIYRPAHYLKQFHKRYVDPRKLQQLIGETRSRDWAQLFLRKDRLDNFDNPDNPTLQPWMLTTAPPAERFIGVRNPYFHRVDPRGQQLPYIDRFILQVIDGRLIPIKTGAGETDLQARHLAMKDYTFLKAGERRSGLRTLLWQEGRAAHLALYPNLNASDPVWRGLFRDQRFRHALALGLDRGAINQFLHFGLAAPANNTILPESPLWENELGTQCLAHDPGTADRLLDELGLDRRDENGTRLLPDGRPMELLIESAGVSPDEDDVLELVREQWSEIGFKVHSRPTGRQVLQNRIFSGEALMSIFYGIDNGVPVATLPPSSYAPTNQADQPQWPKWGQHYETRGAAGEAPDLPEAQRLLELYEQWKATTTAEVQAEIWREMLRLYASQCFTIGIVAGVQQPIAARGTLRNIPERAIFNWEPHAQFGVYLPDTFFYAG
jgi:peptide/nickel transport system substrate-binding protein